MNIIGAITGINSQRSKFKQKCTPQERWKKHSNIIKGNPNYTSIVVEKSYTSKIHFQKPYLLFGLDKSCTILQLKQNICKILKIKQKQAVVLICNKIIPIQNQSMKNLQHFVQPDGFIYFYLSQIEAFG